jgi:DDE superfamily endonuclease/Helix-turn-helix of DDE superfamily endonuclease
MYHTTGFPREKITDMCAQIHAQTSKAKKPWSPKLGLFKSVVVALTYMRRNRVQVELAETYNVSQPTISRVIKNMTPVLGAIYVEYVPTADDLDDREQCIVDGTLLPCWSWADHPELYSAKHKTTGMNVQVACTLSGELAWISDAIDGSRHDKYCIDESGVLVGFDPDKWIGDKGYVGTGMLTPFKKPANGNLLDWQKEYNKQINRIRYVIEQVIANFKTWRIMHTDYRRPLRTFKETISTVIALHFYKIACEGT